MAESPKTASKLINAQISGMINNALMVTTPNYLLCLILRLIIVGFWA
jgi:hypothetical protein